MPVLASVLGAALVTLVVILLASLHRRSGTAMGDPVHAERWLVGHLVRHRSTRRVVLALDRHVWGGAMVGLALITVVVGAATVGWILSTVDQGSGFARFDESAAEWGGRHETGTSTTLLRWITHGGDTLVLLAVVTGVGIVDLVRRHSWSALGFLYTVTLGVAAINNVLKWLVDRERPPVDHLVGSGGSSFPSGHSAVAAAGWAAVAFVASRHLPVGTRRFSVALAASVAVLVASSRVLLGVHWLSDAIAGVIVGWSWFFLVALAFGGRLQRLGEPVERAEMQRRLTEGRVDGPSLISPVHP